MHTQLRTQVRASVNKTNTPTASIIDSQSVKTAEKRGKYTVTMAENGSRDVNALSLLIR
jgi:putative transposase